MLRNRIRSSPRSIIIPVSHGILDGLFYRESGSPHAAGTVLFIHGLGESGLCFEHLLDREELKSWRLLVPDLPGYGRTPRLDGRQLGLGEQADLLADWVRRHGLGKIALIGHSMGGVTATLLAERHPDVATLLIDVDGNISPDDCTYSSVAARQDVALFADGGFQKLLDDIYTRGTYDRALRGYFASLCLADPLAFHLNSHELVTLSRAEDLAQRLAVLPVPTTYIAGVPRGVSAYSRKLLDKAGVSVREMSPSGHWPFVDRPDEFLEAVVGLLAWALK